MIKALASQTLHTESAAVSVGVRGYYVYLCSGDIMTVSPATELICEPQDVVIFDGDCVVARFRRPEVYFVSRKRISPPILF